jgi:amidase
MSTVKRLPLGPLCYELSRHHEPRLRIAPGETIAVESEDAFSGQIRSDCDRRDKTKVPGSNPLAGPIWVEGAEPGDALAVRIEAIRPLIGQCATRTSDPRQLCEWLGDDCPHGTHVCPIRDGKIYWSEELTIPYSPMLGCIGTAPASGSPTSLPAGPYGGNLDIVEVSPGNTVYLPVFVPGGYLYLGDAHAAMGHGELSASGLEMPAESVITVDLLERKRLPAPRIESPSEILAVATGCPLERSVAQAYAWLILWMEAEHGWERWKAYDLLTHTGRLSVGYYAIGTVAAAVAKEYLRGR